MVRGGDGPVRFVAGILGVLLLASYLGALHPVGDSLAVIRVPLALLTALAVIWTVWPPVLRWPVALGLLGLVAWHLLARVPTGAASDHDFTLYQQNLLFDRKDAGAFLEAIAKRAPDFVTLQEVSDANLSILVALAKSHPHQHHCPLNPWVGEAVLSRHPKVPGSEFCSDPDGLAGMQVETPFGPIWLVSVHLRWPWPHGQAAQVDGVLPFLDALEGHVILAGDFNAVAWSHTLRRMARASGTERIGPHLHSFARLPVPVHIGIDHVLTTPTYAQEVRRTPLLGSDHYGLFARLTRPRHD